MAIFPPLKWTVEKTNNNSLRELSFCLREKDNSLQPLAFLYTFHLCPSFGYSMIILACIDITVLYMFQPLKLGLDLNFNQQSI